MRFALQREAADAGADAADGAEGAGGREGVILLRGIYTCPEVEDESKMFGVVKEMNFTLMKLDDSNNNMETTMIQFDAANVTKLIEDYPEQADPFFSCSTFPRSCPFGEDTYSVKKYDFDIEPYRKYLPEAAYKIKLTGTVNSEMIWCTVVEFAVEIED
ncbi:Protein of unknown function [Gryllus bimaculatus]|nr:Protein of unknown function [Gryllus bimaculatus]